MFDDLDDPEKKGMAVEAIDGASDLFGMMLTHENRDVQKYAMNARRQMRYQFMKRSGALEKEQDSLYADQAAFNDMESPAYLVQDEGERNQAILAEQNSLQRRKDQLNDALYGVQEGFDGARYLGTDEGFYRTGTDFMNLPIMAPDAFENWMEPAFRNAQILGNPITEVDGKPHVVTDYGTLEIPDFLGDEGLRDRFREVQLGILPDSNNLIRREGLIGGIPIRLDKAMGGTQQDSLYDVETAWPDVVFPFNPMLFGQPAPGASQEEADQLREGSAAALKDPLVLRGVLNLLQDMDEKGEIDTTFWEEAVGIGLWLGEFAAVNKVAGTIAGKAIKGAATSEKFRRVNPMLAYFSKTVDEWWDMMAVPKQGMGKHWTIPMGGFRTLAEMEVYEVTRGLVVQDVSTSEALVRGFQMAAMATAASFPARIFRKSMAAAFRATNLPGSGWARSVRDVRKAGLGLADTHWDRIRKASPVKGRVSDQINQAFTDQRIAEQVQKSIDGALVGAVFGAHSNISKSGVDFWALSLSQQAAALRHAFTSKEAAANALVFGGSGVLWGGREHFDTELTEKQKKTVEGLTAQVFDTLLTGPQSMSAFREYSKFLREYRDRYPDELPVDVGVELPKSYEQRAFERYGHEPPPPGGQGDIGDLGPEGPTGPRTTPSAPMGPSEGKPPPVEVESGPAIGHLYPGKTPPSEGGERMALVGTPMKPGAPARWPEPPTGRRGFGRMQEMAEGWRFDEGRWLLESTTFEIHLGSEGYGIWHASGERAGRPVENTQTHSTLEGAMAQANRIAQAQGNLPYYTTPKVPEGLEEALSRPEQDAMVRQRGMWELVAEFDRLLERAHPEERASLERKRDEVARQAVEEARAVGRADDAALGKPVKEVEEKLPEERPLTTDDLAATAAAHATDPEYLGKSPEEILAAEGKKRGTPKAPSVSSQERSQTAKRGMPDRKKKLMERDLQTFVRAHGGLDSGDAGFTSEAQRRASRDFVDRHKGRLPKGTRPSDIPGTTEQVTQWEGLNNLKPEIGLSNLVQRPGKGLSTERMLDLAWDNGYFPGKERAGLTYNDFAEALESNRKPEGTFEAEIKTMQEEYDASQQAAYDYYMSQRPEGSMAGSPEYNPEVARAESERYDSDTRFGQASASADQFFDLARRVGAVSERAAPTSPETLRLMWDMATTGSRRTLEKIEQEPTARDPGAIYETLRKRAQDYFAYMQMGARSLSKTDESEDGRTMEETVDAFLEAQHELTELGELTPETQARLKKLGHLNEHGGLDGGLPAVLGEWMDFKMRELETDGDTTLMWTASPLAISIPLGSSGVMGDNFVAYKLFRLDKMLNKLQNEALPPGQRPKGGTALGQGLDRVIWKAIRRPLSVIESKLSDHWGNSLVTSRVQVLRRKAIKDFGKQEAAHSNVLWEFEKVIGGLAFRGLRLSRTQQRKFVEYIDKGIFKRDRNGDEAVRWYGENNRFFFEQAQKITEAVRDLADAGKKAGWLSDAAAARLDAQYIMHASLRAIDAERESGMRNGEMSFFVPRRDMSREESGQNDLALEFTDPYYLLSRMSAQESSLTMLWGVLGDSMEQGWAVSPHEMERPGGRWVRRDIDWFMTAAAEDGKGTGAYNPLYRDLATGRKLVASQRRLYDMLRKEYRRMQSREDWVAGRLPSDGKSSYTERKENILRHFLGPKFNGLGGALLTRHTAEEIDMVLRRFDQPDIGRISRKWNGFMRYWRGNNTIRNSVHWFRNVSDSVGTNYVHGGAHFLDFMDSLVFGRGVFTEGSYARAAEQILDFQDWAEAGKPKVKPDGWSQRKWENALFANQGAETWMGATFVGAVIGEGQHAIRDIVGQFSRPEEMRRGFEEQLQAKLERRREQEIEEEQGAAERLQERILNFTGRISKPLGQRHAEILELIGTPNARDRVDAHLKWGASYQAVEMWMSLAQANTIKARNPLMSVDRVLLKAKEGTRNYRAASGAVRDFTTNFEWTTSAHWNSTENTPQWLRLSARVALSSPFMIYPMGMIPQLIRASAAHPLRALAMSGMGLAVQQAMFAAYGSAQSERTFWEELTNTPNAANLPFIDEKGAKELEKKFRVSLRSKGLNPTDKQLEGLTRMWIRMLYASPDIVPAPGNRVSDISDLIPLGGAAKTARLVRDGHPGDWVEFLDAALPSMTSQFLGGLLEIANPPADTTRGEAIWSRVRKLAGQILPQMDSETWLFSRQGQRVWELAEFGGMDSGKYMIQGIRTLRPSTSEEIVAEALFGQVRPSRKKSEFILRPKHRNLFSDVMVNVFPKLNTATDMGKRKAVVLERVMQQWRQTLRDTYSEWMDGYAQTPLREDEDPIFDLRLNQQNFLQDLDMEAWQAGVHRLKPDDQIVTEVGKQIARMRRDSPGDEGLAIDVTMDFFESAAYGRAAQIMMEAARRREISTGMFMKLYDAAMVDSNGTELLREIHKEVVVQGRRARMERLYPIYLRLPQPPNVAGSEPYRMYQELFGRKGFNVRYRTLPEGPLPRIQDLYPGQGTKFGAPGAEMILKGKRKR